MMFILGCVVGSAVTYFYPKVILPLWQRLVSKMQDKNSADE